MNEEMSDLPQAETADPDGVQVALRAAQTLWSRGETSESLKWLRKAAESASDEGADVRSLQLAKAAAELRAKLFGGGERSGAGEISGAHPIADHAGAAPGRAQPALTSSRPEPDAARSSFPPASYAAEPYSADSHAAGSYAAGLGYGSSDGSSDGSTDGSSSGSSSGEQATSQSSRPVTATQYPSHRPRQRMGLTSSIPGAPPSPREAAYAAREGAYGSRDGAAYAAVPSWSADAERRVSPAPPPLPLSAIDDYEELEAEPDDEPVDDPGSVWSGSGESWRPAAPSAEGGSEASLLAALGAPATTASSAAGTSPFDRSSSETSGLPAGVSSASAGSSGPPPLPPRGAFAEDDVEFGALADAPTVAIPSAEERDRNAGPQGRWAASGDVWDRESRLSGWDQDSGASWAGDLRNGGWGSAHAVSVGGDNDDDLGGAFSVSGAESPSSESPSPSDTARAKLTARVHHQAVRVSFAPDQRVPGQYVVRPLREGERAAAGERIALLVALEPGIPLV